MSTISVSTRAPRHTAPSRSERLLLRGSALLERIALQHMIRRTAATDIERRRETAAEVRRDAQAAAGLQLLSR
ncbi:hypothetical protein [Microbacterium candidum]|uniref:Uncharacterized protein n=1 Tax=Microbacterium candidum TaxID=3041922 RepID=A0ABT7MYR5_9MICO|nr:hypothetical protein [Microbacterium sp. ASV49]MDL9979586.1 hypothetical protein [Microbacterium sp. ASV49]